jgi:hypothetical protein
MIVKRSARTCPAGEPFNVNKLYQHISNRLLTKFIKFCFVKSRLQQSASSKPNKIIEPLGKSACMDRAGIAVCGSSKRAAPSFDFFGKCRSIKACCASIQHLCGNRCYSRDLVVDGTGPHGDRDRYEIFIRSWHDENWRAIRQRSLHNVRESEVKWLDR